MEPEDVAQDEDGELARRQDLERGHERQGDRLGLLVPSLRPQRHVHHALEEGVGERLEPHDLAESGRLRRLILGDVPLLGRAPAGRTARVEAPVGGDPVEPRADRGPFLEPSEALPCGHQRLLEDVLGVLEGSEHPVAVHLELPAVRLDQLLERLAVPGARPVDKVARHRSTLAPRSSLSSSCVPTPQRSRNGRRETAQFALERGVEGGRTDDEEERAMTDHTIGTREEWLAAREELLKREKEHTRLGDEIAQQRRDLPWVRVEKDYRFETDDGEKSLAELFDGRSQLLVYHFMFGPSYEVGCPINSSIADSIDGVVPHLHARDATLLLVSQAPFEKLQAYKRRMGWQIPWVSSSPGDFNFDLGFSQTEEQSREAVARITLPVADRGRVPSGRRAATLARRGPTSSGTSPRAPGSARSSGRATTSTTRTRRRGADWSSS